MVRTSPTTGIPNSMRDGQECRMSILDCHFLLQVRRPRTQRFISGGLFLEVNDLTTWVDCNGYEEREQEQEERADVEKKWKS